MARDVRINIVGDARKLKAETQEAERALDKLTRNAQTGVSKMGPKGFLGGMLGDFGGPTALLAGAATAVGAFAVKAVGDFQRTALEADKLGTSMGTGVEEASRWMEVSGDLGVNMESVAGSFQRMNKAASSGALKALGIDADNASDRFQNVLRYLAEIPDETKRAEEAQRLLGRGWQELAPLVNQVGELRDRLAEVSDTKVIDPEEVQTAREYRDALDNLRDKADDLTLAVGQSLVPVLTDLATVLGSMPDVNDVLPFDLPDWVSSPFGPQVGGFLKAGAALVGIFSDSGDEAKASAADVAILSDEMEVFGGKVAEVRSESTQARYAWADFLAEQERTPGVYNRMGQALQAHERRWASLTEYVNRYRDAMREAKRAQDILTGASSPLDMADAQQSLADAVGRWMTENHEAVYAGELGLDPAKEGPEAEAALRDAARAALALAEMAAAAGKTSQQQAQLAAASLSSSLAANPFLAGMLGGTLAQLQGAATPYAGGGVVPGAFTGDGGIKGAIGRALGMSTVVIQTGADPTAVRTALGDVSGAGATGGVR